MLAPAEDIQWAIDSSYRAIGGVDRLVEAFEAVEGTRRRTSATEIEETEVVADDAPIVQVVTRILTQAKRDRASDVHIEPSQDVVRVRFRIDGALKEVLMLPAAMGIGLVSRIKIMAGMNIVERRRPQDGQLTTVIDGKDTDVRVSTAATIWGEKCVMRILDKNRSVLRLHDLGMPNDTHETFSKLVKAPFGMVLCAGPTGSGKTTTLYATLSQVADPTRNVMTIEDPVEYVFPSINQIQTNEQAGLTFASGLKSILRQDPDVILVGEIRDVETARIAVQSALTGHLVLSSLHATDSVSALHRFLDMGIESFLIASSVIAIVGQRLVRRICPSCKAPYKPTQEETGLLRGERRPAQDRLLPWAPAATSAGNRLPGPHRRLRAAPDDTRDQAPRSSGGQRRTSCAASPRSRACARCARRPSSLVAQDVTTIAEVIREHLRPLSQERNTPWKSTATALLDGNERSPAQSAPRPRARPTWLSSSVGTRPSRLSEKKSVLQFEITKKKVPRKDVMHFSRQLSVFVAAGVPILEALASSPRRPRTSCCRRRSTT